MRQGSVYVFYADLYFLQNFMIKTTAVFLTLWLQKEWRRIAIHKPILGVAAVVMAEIFFLLVGGNYFFAGLFSLLEFPVMFRFLLRHKKDVLLRSSIISLIIILLLNGIVEALWEVFGERGHYLFFVLLGCILTVCVLRIIMLYQYMKKGIYPMTFFHKEKTIHCNGFYDTGNHLTDAYTGCSVHIISEKLAKQLSLEQEKAVLIPYTVLGKETDLIKVYYLEKAVIYDRNREKIQMPIAVGVAEDSLFAGRKFDVILNHNIW